MIKRIVLSKEQVYYAIENGEFQEELLQSKDRVIIVMTQDWCPQWIYMMKWIYAINTEEDIDIYELVYNKTSFFDEFKKFKETGWKNYDIPYLRYYIGGKFITQSNYIRQEEVKKILGL